MKNDDDDGFDNVSNGIPPLLDLGWCVRAVWKEAVDEEHEPRGASWLSKNASRSLKETPVCGRIGMG